MTNVIQFKPKLVAPTSVVKEAPLIGAPLGSAPMHLKRDEPLAFLIANTAAGQVVETLLFYARNGWDEGAKAKKALIAMETVLKSQEKL